MSEQSPADPERTGNSVASPVGNVNVPTEEQKRVFLECNMESIYYRSYPLTAISMAFTLFLISRGVLTASGRFGSLPKVAFAGFIGYLGGKISYMKTCLERVKSMENSPLGEAMQQRQRHQAPVFTQKHTELSDPNKADFEPAFQLDDQRNQSFSYSKDFTYSDPMSSAAQYNTQITEPTYVEEDVQKKPILYKELRSKNRENFEVTTTQNPETLLKPSPETVPAKKGKKNIYGDTWEE